MRDQKHVNSLKPSLFTLAHPDPHNLPAFLTQYFYSSLTSLKGVRQDPRYHPEGDVLYHSLQVFQLAYHACDDPELWAAALLHDIGKASNTRHHANIGADELEGLLSPRIVWLIRHHLHLLIAPKRTRRWLRNTPQLRELEWLRSWDLKGRSPSVTVITPKKAINILMKYYSRLLSPNQTTSSYYENKALG